MLCPTFVYAEFTGGHMKKSGITLQALICILLGNAGQAVAFNCFFSPNEIAAGGFGGLALVLSTLIPISVGLLVIILSVPMFIWSYFVQGLEYTISALLSTVAFSAFVDLFSFLPCLTENKLLAAICGGLIYGAAAYILVRGYVAGTGTELLARLMVTKIRHISMGTMILILDGIVILLSVIVFGDLETSIYAIGSIAIASYSLDALIKGGNKAVIFQIITDGDADKLADEIMKSLDRGVTLIPAKGMYERKERDMLMVVVSPREVYAFKDIVRRLCPNAFIVMLSANEVMGEGFGGLDVTVPVKNVSEEQRKGK
jgi:uncharacterized membrane-anchored protein YitT (DUF2179 family)